MSGVGSGKMALGIANIVHDAVVDLELRLERNFSPLGFFIEIKGGRNQIEKVTKISIYIFMLTQNKYLATFVD